MTDRLRRCGHQLGDTRWCPDCALAEERNRGRTSEPAAAPAAGEPTVTDAMVSAYLQANDAYWKRTDELPQRIGKWRNGTVSEATRVSLRAALAAATPSVPQTHPVHQVLPSLGLHATDGRAETCVSPQWFPLLGTGLGIHRECLNEARARQNHGQSLDQLAQRGGLSPSEALAVINREQWRHKSLKEALTELVAITAPSATVSQEPTGSGS